MGFFFLKGSKFSPLRAVPYGMENHFYHIVAIFITHVRNCIMGATPMIKQMTGVDRYDFLAATFVVC